MTGTPEPAPQNGAVAARRTGKAAWKREFFALMAIGLPMGLTQLVQFSINTVDLLMIGRLGPEPLGGAALGLVMYYVLFLTGLGPAMAVSPLVSQALGANPKGVEIPRRAVRMGLWAIAIAIPPLSLIFFFTEEISLVLGQPLGPAQLAEPYVLALAPGLPFMLGVVVLRNFLAAIERASAPLVIIVLTTVLNAFLNYLLIYGNWGMPRLELVGAGLASSISHLVGFIALVAYIKIEKISSGFKLFKELLTPDWARLREIAHLGWPIGLTIGFEAMLFNAATFLMGRIGIDELAAYQVAINVAAFAFMMPLGLSMAGSVRVGLKAGAGDKAGVRRAAVIAVISSIGAIMIVAIPVMVAQHGVAGLYLQSSDPNNAAVIALIVAFLPIAAAFALFDATPGRSGSGFARVKRCAHPHGHDGDQLLGDRLSRFSLARAFYAAGRRGCLVGSSGSIGDGRPAPRRPPLIAYAAVTTPLEAAC